MTDPERRRRVEDLCDAAMSRTPAERAAFLAAACGDDEGLRHDVEALLAHAETADGFLEGSIGAVAASVLGEAPGALAGRQIGAYRIVSLLGAGGMGEVYRAHDSRLRRDVAVKILPASVAADPARIARFEREARMLAALTHPHIAAIYGIEETALEGPADAGRHVQTIRALVLELVEGPTLADRLRAGPLPVAEALTFATQIAEALEAAHEKGIVHRDLKPANIKVTPSGAVKVLDFGLAKLTQASGAVAQASDLTAAPTLTIDRTQTGMIAGTPAYMSPEQARGQIVDKRTDIWAFGCVLYEMLTGRAAFRGATTSDTIAAILDREIEWDALPASTPPSIRVLLRRSVHKDLNRRLHDIADARLEIEDVLGGRDHGAAGPAIATRGTRHRERLAWIVAAFALLVAIALSTVTIPPAFRQPPAAPQLRLEVSTPPTTDALSLALSPDGQALVFVADSEGVPRLWLRALSEATARPLPGSDDAAFPFWSPDSRSIGFFAEGKLKRLDLTGGPAHTLADARIGRGGTWNRDGVILFAPSASDPIFRVPAEGGEAVAVTTLDMAPPDQVGHRFPQFLPDGRRFLFHVVGSPKYRGVYAASLDNPAVNRLLDTDTAAVASSGHLWFLREGTLFAQRFDPERLELAGSPASVAEHLAAGVNVAALSSSPSGPIAFRTGESGGRRQFLWFDRAGKVVGTAGAPDAETPVNPHLSPDGRRLALNRTMNGNTDIWLLERERGALSRFTFNQAIDAYPVWSPDGRRIVFGSNQLAPMPGLYEKPASGAGVEKLLLARSRGNMAPLDWSSDGRYLLYRGGPLPGFDLWVLPMNGDGKPFPVVETAFDERDGQFSPDGRWIAYESNESGRFEIYVQSFPERGGTWQISNAGGAQVRWRRDGQELFYVGLDGRLMAVPFRVAPDGRTVEPGTPVPLFVTRMPGGPLQGAFRQQYVVSPDGQRFLINSLIPSAASPITLVVNWPALVKR